MLVKLRSFHVEFLFSGNVESMLLSVGVDKSRIYVTVLDALRSQHPRLTTNNNNNNDKPTELGNGHANSAFEAENGGESNHI